MEKQEPGEKTSISCYSDSATSDSNSRTFRGGHYLASFEAHVALERKKLASPQLVICQTSNLTAGFQSVALTSLDLLGPEVPDGK